MVSAFWLQNIIGKQAKSTTKTSRFSDPRWNSMALFMGHPNVQSPHKTKMLLVLLPILFWHLYDLRNCCWEWSFSLSLSHERQKHSCPSFLKHFELSNEFRNFHTTNLISVPNYCFSSNRMRSFFQSIFTVEKSWFKSMTLLWINDKILILVLFMTKHVGVHQSYSKFVYGKYWKTINFAQKWVNIFIT